MGIGVGLSAVRGSLATLHCTSDVGTTGLNGVGKIMGEREFGIGPRRLSLLDG